MRLRSMVGSFVGAVSLAVALVACGGAPSGPDLEALATQFVGTWEMSSAEFTDQSVSEDDYELIAGMGMHVTLDLDGSGNILLDAFGQQIEGTWEIKDESTVSVTIEGDTVDMPYVDDVLTLEYDGESMNFKKLDDEPDMDRDPSENSGGGTLESLDEELRDDVTQDTPSSVSDLLTDESMLAQQLYAESVTVSAPLSVVVADDETCRIEITGVGEDFEGDSGYLVSFENRSDQDLVITNVTTTLDGTDVWDDATLFSAAHSGDTTMSFFFFDQSLGEITESSVCEFGIGVMTADESPVAFYSASLPQ